MANLRSKLYLALHKYGEVVLKPLYPKFEPFSEESALVQGADVGKIVATACGADLQPRL